MNFLEHLEDNAGTAPDSPARIYLDREGRERLRISHRGLRDRVRGLRDRLREQGSEGAVLPLVFDPGPDFAIAFFACLAAGAVPVPVPPMDPARAASQNDHLAGLCAQTSAGMVLSSGRHAALLNRDVFDIGTAGRAGETRLEADPEALATLLFTSGSTSAPKGVTLRHRQMLANAHACCKRWEIDDRSVLASWMPDHHSFGLVYNLLLPAISGACLVSMAPAAFVRRPRSWLEMVSGHRCSHGASAVFGYQHVNEQVDDLAGLDLSCWRVGLISAEPVRRGVCARFSEKMAAAGLPRDFFCALYGLSEAGPVTSMPVATRSLFDGPADVPSDQHTACLGKPLEGVEVVIANPCEKTGQGEVLVASEGLMDGYFHNEAADREAFVTVAGSPKRFFRTGDQGFLREGRLFLTGRIKEILIVRGRNLHPIDLECSARAADPQLGLGKAAAFGIETPRGEEIAVVVELDGGLAPECLGQLAGKAADRIADALGVAVTHLVFVPFGSVPTTASGKVRRGACREAFLAGELPVLYGGRQHGDRPEEVVTVLRERFAAILHLPVTDLDVAAPLSDYEIDSMTFTELAGLLSEDLGRKVQPADLFTCETLGELADYLEGGQR